MTWRITISSLNHCNGNCNCNCDCNGELVPTGLTRALGAAVDAQQFVQGYADAIGGALDDAGVGGALEAAGVEHATWESAKPADGLDGVPEGDAAQRVVGQSYRQFAAFLKSVGFDKTKLDGRVALVGGRPAWVASSDAAAASSSADVTVDVEPKKGGCCVLS